MGMPFLVMGATGRIGQVIRGQTLAPELRPIWQSRRPKSGFLTWDMLAEPCPNGAASGVTMCLAGVIQNGPGDLAQNESLALAACRAAVEQGGKHVFLASSAAVYGSSPNLLREDTSLAPIGAYGEAKAAAERSAQAALAGGEPGLTILRIGNIAGLDALLGAMKPDVPVRLDAVAGQPGGPVRSYIGPVSLARVLVQLAGLAARGVVLPRVINVAAGAVSMADLLDAAGANWSFGGLNPTVIPRVEMDVTVLHHLVDLPPQAGDPAAMVAEWRGRAG